MKYEIRQTSRFKKDFKNIKKQNRNLRDFHYVIEKLANGERLEEKYKDHPLKGEYKDFRECHIAPDWLLIYLINDNVLTLTLSRTGSHSELLDM